MRRGSGVGRLQHGFDERVMGSLLAQVFRKFLGRNKIESAIFHELPAGLIGKPVPDEADHLVLAQRFELSLLRCRRHAGDEKQTRKRPDGHGCTPCYDRVLETLKLWTKIQVYTRRWRIN